MSPILVFCNKLIMHLSQKDSPAMQGPFSAFLGHGCSQGTQKRHIASAQREKCYYPENPMSYGGKNGIS